MQDQGACMSIHAVRLYYYYCDVTIENLAVFPKSIAGSDQTALTTEKGVCLDHAVVSNLGGKFGNFLGDRCQWR